MKEDGGGAETRAKRKGEKLEGREREGKGGLKGEERGERREREKEGGNERA